MSTKTQYGNVYQMYREYYGVAGECEYSEGCNPLVAKQLREKANEYWEEVQELGEKIGEWKDAVEDCEDDQTQDCSKYCGG